MTRRTRNLLLTLGSVLLFLSLMSPASGAAQAVRKEGNFWLLETRHYLIKTDVSADFAKDIADLMESCYTAYSKYTRGKPKFVGKSTAVVFAKEKDYLARPGVSRNSSGQYSPNTRELSSFLEKQGEEIVFETLRHEGFHQFYDRWVGGIEPIWLNEGLAEFFRQTIRDGKELKPGVVLKAEVNLLSKAFEGKDLDLIGLKELMLMDNIEWSRNVERRAQKALLEYLEARLTVQFLLSKPEYVKVLDKFLWACGSDKYDREECTRIAFGGNLASISKAWLDYMKHVKPYMPESCWVNLHYLGTLLRIYVDNGVKVETPEALLEAVKTNKSITWWIGEMGGGPDDKTTQNDLDVVQKWFHCPKEKKLEGCSYEFVKSESKCGYPDIICRNHGSVLLRATIVPADGKGKFRTVVREEPLKKK